MLSAALVVAALAWAGGGCAVGPYVPPVVAPVVDGFRLPGGPYQAGNRGLEYDTAPAQPVGSIGPGTVSFAGTIAGERYVSVRHLSGLVSSYSYLATIAVTEGDTVAAGQALGTAGDRFHLVCGATAPTSTPRRSSHPAGGPTSSPTRRGAPPHLAPGPRRNLPEPPASAGHRSVGGANACGSWGPPPLGLPGFSHHTPARTVAPFGRLRAWAPVRTEEAPWPSSA